MEDRILVTGSTGFLGRALLASLSAKKYNVTAFLRPSSSESLIPQGTSGMDAVLGWKIDQTDIIWGALHFPIWLDFLYFIRAFFSIFDHDFFYSKSPWHLLTRFLLSLSPPRLEKYVN